MCVMGFLWGCLGLLVVVRCIVVGGSGGVFVIRFDIIKVVVDKLVFEM